MLRKRNSRIPENHRVTVHWPFVGLCWLRARYTTRGLNWAYKTVFLSEIFSTKLIVSKCEIVGKPTRPFAYYHFCSGKRQLIVNYLQPGRDVIDYITFDDRIVKLRFKYTKMK